MQAKRFGVDPGEPFPPAVSLLSCSDSSQPPQGLHAGGVHCHWRGRLLVRLHPESLLQGAHEEDDEGPGGSAQGRAVSP